MDLNTGALSSGGYINEGPDTLGSLAKGAALGADLQNIADKQEDAKKKRMVVSNLPSLMGRIKENQSDFDAVAQVAQYAPGMIDYINNANKQDTEVADKRKAELVNNLAGAYAFIASADQRGQPKEQVWQDVMKWNQAHGIDMGDLANEPYSDAAMARMKGLVLGTKALTEGGERFGNIVWTKDAQGNVYPAQLSKTGDPVPLTAPAGQAFLEPTETVNTGTSSVQRGRFSGALGASTAVGPSATALYEKSPEVVAGVERAKEVGAAAGKKEAAISGREIDARSTLSLLDEAEKLIPVATGSYLGAGRDIAGAVVGETTKGAEALASLKIIGNKLVQFVPRMEGPQSDKDVASYKEAAGDFANPTTTSGQKMAALKTMRALNEKYASQNQQPSAVNVTGAPKKISNKAQYDALPSGAMYIAPDGTARRKK